MALDKFSPGTTDATMTWTVSPTGDITGPIFLVLPPDADGNAVMVASDGVTDVTSGDVTITAVDVNVAGDVIEVTMDPYIHAGGTITLTVTDVALAFFAPPDSNYDFVVTTDVNDAGATIDEGVENIQFGVVLSSNENFS